MERYKAEVIWTRGDDAFLDNRYSRRHLLRFDGGVEVIGSASPHIVPLPYSLEHAVDPEEAFVSALSACHMLWFLSLAADANFVVDSYHDQAVGQMESLVLGRKWIAIVSLHPSVKFSGDRVPTPNQIDRLHEDAHRLCFIANSVRTTVRYFPC
ncbi:MAG: OsmC family peroxiredoxin [Deltaproteobacteria bacterium]|nr:OsmC family peroxiredoxin [Deltaproteobacteria bacterium]